MKYLWLFLVAFVVLLRTLCPTVYTLDSAELATGASVLGIVHAPGYPLYLIIAHLFTLLPVGDVAFRVNLFSAVSLALTAPVLYSLLRKLTGSPLMSATAALTFVWSFYVWSSANKAEIYAPQILTLALCAWSLGNMYQDYLAQAHASHRNALYTGALFGVALAMAPSSIFFAPGLVIAFLLMRVRLHISLFAGLLGVGVVLAVLLYFPLRGSALPEFNKIGWYDEHGIFQNYDYFSLHGILQAVSAQQFRHLFFTNGVLPSTTQLVTTLSWFWRNYLAVGAVMVVIGGAYLLRHRRGLFAGWLALSAPYSYFYLCYGAIDRDTMFGPTWLALAVLLAFGLCWLAERIPERVRVGVAVGLPLLALITNFSAVDLSHDTSVRNYAETVLESLPPNAVVAGYWPDITPLQYLQHVEHQRPDVKIFDLFMFESGDFRTYVNNLSKTGQTPIILTRTAIMNVPDSSYKIEPLVAYLPNEYELIEFPIFVGVRIS